MDILGSEEHTDSCSEVGLAARHGKVEELKHLLTQGRPVDIADARGWRPLHEASVSCTAEHLMCMEELLKCGNSDVNCQTVRGETALFLACKFGDEYHSLEAVDMLLFAGASVNTPDSNGTTPLLIATQLVHAKIVHVLLNTRVADTNLGDSGGWRPLHHAGKDGQADLVRTLLSFGAQLDVKTSDGMTPLDIAAGSGSLECLKLLLEAARERSQLHLVQSRHRFMPRYTLECVELLLSYNANINLNNALIKAIQQKDPNTVKLLLQVMDVEGLKSKIPLLPSDISRDRHAFGAIHLAVRFQSHACLRILLESGLPVDSIYLCNIESLNRQERSMIRLPFFETALSLSFWKNDVEAAQILLSAGASSNATGDEVFSPLVSAIMNGSSKEIDLLIDHGADFTSGGEVLLVALGLPENLYHILRRGANPSSCFTSNFSSVAYAISRIENQDEILLVLEMLITFLDHKPQATDLLLILSKGCRELFGTEYDTLGWFGLFHSVLFPSSLLPLCRSSVRRHLLKLHTKSLEDRINSLQLPQTLISYLNYENTVFWNCFLV